LIWKEDKLINDIKMEAPRNLTDSIPDPYERFFSNDPYEVLGVNRSASETDIRKAWKDALKMTHPDIFNDPRATEITQRIIEAYDKVSLKEEKIVQLDEQTKVYIIKELSKGVDFLKKYCEGHPNIPLAGVTEVLKTPDAQSYISRYFINHVDTPLTAVRYISEWQFFGIDVRGFLSQDKITAKIKKCTFDRYISYCENPEKLMDSFVCFLNEWRCLGVDLYPLLAGQDAVNIYKRCVGFYTNIARPPSEKFLGVVDSWQKVGVNLLVYVNEPNIQTKLEKHALSITNKADCRTYTESWSKLGWTPSLRVMTYLNS
jgi:hypothetical protein